MADRQFECPIPRIKELPATMVQATVNLQNVALKWRELAERRRDHFIELYRSGRWKHYYEIEEFRNELRAAIAIARRWATIAPRPEEQPQSAARARLAPIRPVLARRAKAA
jgi:hypothetical protein